MKNIKSNISTIKHSIRVRDIMTVKVFSLSKGDPVEKAVKLMAEKKISTVVICERKKPIGIVTERDMVKKVLFTGKNTRKSKLQEIMTLNPAVVSPDDSILKASEIMRTKEVRKLIVVDGEGELLGIISQTDIIRSMNRIYNSYSHLLWNPWLALFFFLFLTAMFLLNWFVFKK